MTHSLYEDLRRVEHVNRRIKWRQGVTDLLDAFVPARTRRASSSTLIDEIRDEKGSEPASEDEKAELARHTTSGSCWTS